MKKIVLFLVLLLIPYTLGLSKVSAQITCDWNPAFSSCMAYGMCTTPGTIPEGPCTGNSTTCHKTINCVPPSATGHACMYTGTGSCQPITGCPSGQIYVVNCSAFHDDQTACEAVTGFACKDPPGYTCGSGPYGLTCSVCSTPPCQYPGSSAGWDSCTQNCGNPAPMYCAHTPGTGVDTALGCLNAANPKILVSQLLNLSLGLSGGIGLLMIIYAGFQMVTAGGDPKKVQAAKELITAVIFGLIFMALCVVFLNFIGTKILNLQNLGFRS